MTKRMLIDDTRPEETRVVIVNGNKVEDVEFESASRKQIKGNIYLAKVMRVEPSLQAAFVDYGGNKHGFLAFGEIHPDYYNVSEEELASIDKEVDEIIEAKKQAIKEREAERERHRAEKAAQYAAREEERKAREAAEAKAAEAAENGSETSTPVQEEAVTEEKIPAAETTSAPNESLPEAAETTAENGTLTEETPTETVPQEETAADLHKHPRKKRILKKRARKAQQAPKEEAAETEPAAPEQEKAEKEEKLTVMAESTKEEEETVQEEVDAPRKSSTYNNMAEEDVVEEDDDEEDDDEEDDSECDFEIQRKLMKIRKLFHRSKIQDVIKEGQILLVQVVKEERGNKGAALTTYLSLAGRYCVLMPNRIKSGGVSRKITNVADRKRLKNIVKELPLNNEMSMIVRTAGEEKTKADIIRDYNYLIRSWNQIRLDALKGKAPALIHEEGNLIRRALRDMYTKDISEIIVDGEQAYKAARDFVKILSPHNLKKIKENKKGELPLFQRFQVEAQLDKLHDTNVQLESGGYLVINPTEALVSIDVNSGRATKEKDLEETALKTNLEAADEIAKQLRMRNLAGLVVVDFIDMEEQKNNLAVEKRMKEAMKKDRARIQIAKMSCFGLLEISRQRMHSSFFESNYQVCPHCHGKGIVRTIESGAVFVLRCIEEEGIKNRCSRINLYLPSEFALYLLNQKRKCISDLEQRYNMEVIICADDLIKNIADLRIERIKAVKTQDKEEDKEENGTEESSSPRNSRRQPNKGDRKPRIKEETAAEDTPVQEDAADTAEASESVKENRNEDGQENEGRRSNRRRDRRNRFDRRNNRRRDRRNYNDNGDNENNGETKKEKAEAVILYNSHEDIKSPNVAAAEDNSAEKAEQKGKTTWWRKLIKS